jgi:hypothetical protein
MRNVYRLSVAVMAAALVSAAAMAQELPPREEAEEIEEDLGFGYSARDGALAVAVDTSAVFCPVPGVLVVDRTDEADVVRILGAKDLGEGRWEVPNPDTGAPVVANVQYAAYSYAEANDTPTPAPTDATSVEVRLPVIARADVTIAPHPWPCRRILRGYICGTPGNCGNGACQSGHRITQARRFLTCRFTGNRQDRCLQFLAPVCRLTRYTCRDCTGPIVGTWPLRRWVCAVF